MANALAHGWTLDDYLDTLEMAARASLPGNVATNIEDWFRVLSRHQILDVVLLHSESPQDSLHAEKVLAKLARGRLTPTDLVLPAHNLAAIRKALDKAGLPIRSDVGHLSASDPADDLTEADEPWLGEPFISVVLPDPATMQSRSVETVMAEAISRRQGVVVSYLFPNLGAPRTLHVAPVGQNGRWVQVLDLAEGRLLQLDLQAILTVSPLG